MPLQKSTDTIKLLAEKDPFFGGNSLQCWKKTEDRINIHAFSFLFPSTELLLQDYAEIRDRIAIFFQSQLLESAADRWNLYIFYFVNGQLDPEKKQAIEQDKFSSRKFVMDLKDVPEICDVNFSEQGIEDSINKELFDLEIPKRSLPESSLSDMLFREHKKVFDIVTKFKNRAETGQILNFFENGQD